MKWPSVSPGPRRVLLKWEITSLKASPEEDVSARVEGNGGQSVFCSFLKQSWLRKMEGNTEHLGFIKWFVVFVVCFSQVQSYERPQSHSCLNVLEALQRLMMSTI